jgi:hypothetical protein
MTKYETMEKVALAIEALGFKVQRDYPEDPWNVQAEHYLDVWVDKAPPEVPARFVGPGAYIVMYSSPVLGIGWDTDLPVGVGEFAECLAGPEDLLRCFTFLISENLGEGRWWRRHQFLSTLNYRATAYKG